MGIPFLPNITPYAVQFKLKAVSRTSIYKWFTMGPLGTAEAAAKKALRRGGIADLNIYTGQHVTPGTDLQLGGCGRGGLLRSCAAAWHN